MAGLNLFVATGPDRSGDLLLPECGACKLNLGCRSPKMPHTGRGRRKFLIVAEAPGEEEDKQNKQLVGRTGQHLERTLKKLGFDMRQDAWLTNALICRPPDNKIPDVRMVDYCRPNLIKTIQDLNPEVIIPLGVTPLVSLIHYAWKPGEVEDLTRWYGWQIPCQKLNAWICPTWHPSYLVREKNPDKARLLETFWTNHLKAAVGLDGRPWPDGPPDYPGSVEVILDPGQAAARVKDFEKRGKPIAFDYETNMLKPDSDKAKIWTCSISDGEETIAFPWAGRDVIKACGDLFFNKDVKKRGQNIKFEERWTRAKLGRGVAGWEFDDMLGQHVADCRRHITGLGFQAFVHLGAPDWYSRLEPYLVSDGGNVENRIRHADLRDLLVYNGVDSLIEFQLAPILKKKLKL